MVTTRAAARAQTPLGKAPPSDLSSSEPSIPAQNGKKTWAETAGAGEHIGAWGIGGTAGHVLAYTGTLALMIGCPAFAIYLWGFTLFPLKPPFELTEYLGTIVSKLRHYRAVNQHQADQFESFFSNRLAPKQRLAYARINVFLFSSYAVKNKNYFPVLHCRITFNKSAQKFDTHLFSCLWTA